MKKITIKEFLRMLAQSEHVVLKYDSNRFGDLPEDECEFFECDGYYFAKIYDDEQYEVYAWLTEEKDCKAIFSQQIEDESCVALGVSATFVPSDFDGYNGAFCFEGKYSPYRDETVRKLTEEDSQAIKDLAALLKNGTRFEQREAECFEYIVENKLFTALGAFEQGRLVGMLFYRPLPENGLVVLSEMAVAPSYQSKGYGKRLLKSALNLYPDYRYIYHCNKHNAKSVALAKSCGLILCGVENMMVKDEEE